MSKLTTTWWIVFYKDQLLLKKQNNKLTIPCNEQPPLPIPAVPMYTKYVFWRDSPARPS